MSRKHVLLIEDDPVNARIYRRILESSGCDVTHSADGIEALDLARRISPDVILLDWLLPRLDGFKICKLLKMDRRFRGIPVIVMTALSEPSELERIKAAGAEEVLAKTSSVKAVQGVLENFLDLEIQEMRRLDS